MAATLSPTLEGILEPTLNGMGFELVDAQVSNRGRFVRIFMDKPGGITLEDCAAVSRHLSRVLEVEGIDYDRLEVSSPGLDRPLRKAADFARFAGQKVDVRMRLADASGRRRFVGILVGVDASVFAIEVEGSRTDLSFENLDRARLVPEFQERTK